ncbi:MULTISPECIES: WcaI family glycosyltransferase [unclassified Bradyrhizobium]|uniref:WcaI family glycosyltransferase n=1 Tax=unclassified Bradyrhizobium TaxID=2631580 RepID=UPI0009E8C53F|nr:MULTISPECIES: WcaI family glycosyltransferase [unclassified Bradyrhizobium]
MRILVVGINYAPDLIGVAKYTTEFCESMAAWGHEVRVVTGPPYYPDWSIPQRYRSSWYVRERLNDVEVIRAPIYVPARPSGLRRLLHHASFLVSAAGPLLSGALFWRPDIVFVVAPSLLSAPVAALAARLVGAAPWVHVQDLEVDAAFEVGLLRGGVMRRIMAAFERWILKAFERVSTISPQMMARLEHKGIAPGRLREFRNWIDTGTVTPGCRQTPLRAELCLEAGDIVALYSGAMSNKQGLELIVEAAAAVEDLHPSLKFVLCGNGPAKPALMQMSQGLTNVRFLDLQPLDRVSELLSTADIQLLPQKAEIADLVLPSKLAGMLASGRPLVAMAKPGTGLAAEVEGAGLVIEPSDAGALARALLTLASDDALRARMGAVARRRAEQKWDRISIMRSLEREFMALPQCAPSPAALIQQPALPARSIEHVSTGSRRRPDAPGRLFSRQSMRAPSRGVLSARSASELERP